MLHVSYVIILCDILYYFNILYYIILRFTAFILYYYIIFKSIKQVSFLEYAQFESFHKMHYLTHIAL